MDYKILYVFVEGNDDERFFRKIFVSKLQEKTNCVKFIKYAQKTKKYVIKYLESIRTMGKDYIYVSDINNSPCVTAKKQEIKDKLQYIDTEKIIVVIKEIESWYLAGLSDTDCNNFKMNTIITTDNITKEKFNGLIPQKFDSRIDFMLEILKKFSVKVAMKKNRSFNYFIQKYDCDNFNDISNSR